MPLRIATYQSSHFAGVEALWKEAFPNDAPWSAAALAIPEKLRVQPDLMLVALDGGAVVGSAGYAIEPRVSMSKHIKAGGPDH